MQNTKINPAVRKYSNPKNSIEDYQASLIAKQIEESPEQGGINLKQLAKKYQLKY